MKEEKAISIIHDRDPEGLRWIMDRYVGYVSAVVWNILRYAMSAEDAEEVVSDVFLTAWERPEALQPGKVKAWLGAVARNMAKNKLRQLGKTIPLEEDLLELADETGPTQILEEEEERQLVRSALDALPPKDRELFLRHYYYAQTVEEIAKELRMPPSTVKSRLRRGRQKLKEILIRRGL